MEESKFFRFVWRFNGLILMVAGVLAIGVLAFAGYKIYTDKTRDRAARSIVNVREDVDVKEEWRLGHMTHIQGTPFVMIALSSDQRYAQSYYSKSTSAARNYLFLDSQSSEKHWLFGTNDFLIADMELLSERELGPDPREVRAISFRVVKNDTNGDKRLTDNDLITLGLALPNGKGYKEVLDGIDRFIGQRLISTDSLLIVYEKKGVGYSANIKLPEFVIANEEALPKVSP